MSLPTTAQNYLTSPIAAVIMHLVRTTHSQQMDLLGSTVVSTSLSRFAQSNMAKGVNTLSFQKHITSQELTKEGLDKLGPVVVTLAECEGLRAHANAVRVRLGIQSP